MDANTCKFVPRGTAGGSCVDDAQLAKRLTSSPQHGDPFAPWEFGRAGGASHRFALASSFRFEDNSLSSNEAAICALCYSRGTAGKRGAGGGRIRIQVESEIRLNGTYCCHASVPRLNSPQVLAGFYFCAAPLYSRNKKDNVSFLSLAFGMTGWDFCISQQHVSTWIHCTGQAVCCWCCSR